MSTKQIVITLTVILLSIAGLVALFYFVPSNPFEGNIFIEETSERHKYR